MPMPTEIPVIDLMMGIPGEAAKGSYDFMRPLFRDEESSRSFDFPVDYMFKDVPFADTVWPKFLRGNAERLLGLAD